jgi:prepilin-type N-terminal cleavage/methylation domain-containing protein
LLYTGDNRGFTLIELVVVIAILAIMSVVALPKLTGIIGNERKESSILKAYIEAVTDDSFVHRKTNYLCINLAKSGNKNSELFDDRYNDTNIVIVYELQKGKFIQNKNHVLKDRGFSSSFILDEVILEGGKSITSGNVIIPFYSDGTSAGFLLKIISGDSKIIFKKNKINKMVQFENEN